MSQTIIDPRSQVPAPTRENTPLEYEASSYPIPTAPAKKSDSLSFGAIVCAIAGVVLSCIPLFVSGVPVALAIGATSVGLVFGALAAVLGVMGRGRAMTRGIGMTGLVVGILSLIWTIGGFACTIPTSIH